VFSITDLTNQELSAGSSVVTDWTTGRAIIENDEWLWVRLTSSASNSTTLTLRVHVGRASDNWAVTTEAA
jgi:hypothetical protein